jgi:hypothetical protein
MLTLQNASGALKRKSISFEEGVASPKTSKPTKPATPRHFAPVRSGPKAGSTIYAPPQGKYSKNVGQFGELIS